MATRQKNDLLSKLYRRYVLYRYFKPFERKCALQNNINPQSTIVLFANPRGGSTWIAEALQSIPKSAVILEPLYRGNIIHDGTMPPTNAGRIPAKHRVQFYYNQPIPEDADWPEAQAFMRKLLNREIVTLSIYYENELRDVPQSDVFIFKMNYANMMIPWMVKNFAISPILLVRHPCAVVASQFTYGTWHRVIANPRYVVPEFRYSEYYHQYQDILRTIKTPEENLAATWCLNFVASAMHPKNDASWTTVAYESLLTRQEAEVHRIFNRLQKPVPEKVFEQLRTPSLTTQGKSREALQTDKQLTSWQRKLTTQQIDNIMGIVQAFGINIYTREPEPDYQQLYKVHP